MNVRRALTLVLVASACKGRSERAADAGATADARHTSADGGTADAGPRRSIQGRVIDDYLHPIAGVVVLVAGQTATTDASGTFQLDAPAGTYDLVAAIPAKKMAVDYIGLTRPDPTVVIRTSTGSPAGDLPRSAEIVNDVAKTELCVTAPEVATESLDPIYWAGPPVIHVSAHLIAADHSTTPSTYTGALDLPDLALDEGTAIHVAGTLQSITTGQVTGTIAFPTGHTNTTAYSVVLTRDGCGMQGDQLGPGSFVSGVPVFPTLSLAVAAIDQDPSGSQASVVSTGHHDGDVVNLTVPIVPSAHQVTGYVDTTTPLAWDAAPDASIYLVRIFADGAPELLLVTNSTQVTIPDLSSIGLGLSSKTNYNWQIRSRSADNTVDEAASLASANELYLRSTRSSTELFYRPLVFATR